MQILYIILIAGGFILLANILASCAYADEPTKITAPLIAAVIVHEAGGERVEGMNAVAGVIQERSRRQHKTPFQVVTARKQFSCLNNVGDPHDAFVIKARHLWSKEWPHALQLAYFLNSNISVETSMKGATHYCRVDCNPAWVNRCAYVGRIGLHQFFRED